MTQAPKPDLSEHEEEAAPFEDVMRKLLSAKPAPAKVPPADPVPPSKPD